MVHENLKENQSLSIVLARRNSSGQTKNMNGLKQIKSINSGGAGRCLVGWFVTLRRGPDPNWSICVGASETTLIYTSPRMWSVMFLLGWLSHMNNLCN